MSYQALYRVFRPQVFEDVVGQEHITKNVAKCPFAEKKSFLMLTYFQVLEEQVKQVLPKSLLRQ
ncbi:hypothetical protein BsIDN1_00500 [Bacillus safensis]|uniref:Uncharacterized protein n=1 Tax=Bacillus safensis TaxID=561879 RepID=A0A5S9M139_BACIA|nr:hypothetical protein BsIDN1_00500 [Bacillus safensis]